MSTLPSTLHCKGLVSLLCEGFIGIVSYGTEEKRTVLEMRGFLHSKDDSYKLSDRYIVQSN